MQPKKANGENKGPIRLSRHVTRIVHTKEGNTGVLMWGHPGSAIGTLHASLLRTISQSRVVEECNQRRTGFDEGEFKLRCLSNIASYCSETQALTGAA